jgi:hypothetical protein
MAVLRFDVRESDGEKTIRNERIDFQRVAPPRARAAEGTKRLATELEWPAIGEGLTELAKIVEADVWPYCVEAWMAG